MHFTHLKAFLYLIYIISSHPTQVLWQVYKTPGLYIKIDVLLVHVYLNVYFVSIKCLYIFRCRQSYNTSGCADKLSTAR